MSEEKPVFVRELEPVHAGSQKLWRLGQRYVVTSAITIMGSPETYVFGSDSYGSILDWTDLPGSEKGHLDHDRAVNAHYDEIVASVRGPK